MYKTSESLNEIFAALSKVQAVIQNPSKNADNPHYRKPYADLASVLEACLKPLADNGLSLNQGVVPENGAAYLETTLGHASGQFITYRFPLLTAKGDMQSLGGAVTYARRYSLCSMLGVFPEDEKDDDGEQNRRDANEKEFKEVVEKKMEKKVIKMSLPDLYNVLRNKCPIPNPGFGIVENFVHDCLAKNKDMRKETPALKELTEQDIVDKLIEDPVLYKNRFELWHNEKQVQEPPF